jgi:hypothetical protein
VFSGTRNSNGCAQLRIGRNANESQTQLNSRLSRSLSLAPKVGFSDCLVLEIARKAGHLPLGSCTEIYHNAMALNA